jgi:oxalate decarboxylase/phosphoglucose isomerase-like protein (cupin superfamily)
MADFDALLKSLQQTGYHQWMKSEGIPVVVGHGLEDVREVKLAPWPRTGGLGAFVHLRGMEGLTGMYVAEIPPGGALRPEKHIYEELVCVLDGQGATEVWNEGGRKSLFEWGPMSLFSPPLNTRHRLINGGREPVKFLALTNAPMILDAYRNPAFVFDNPFVFSDRFAGEEGYFNLGTKRYPRGNIHVWETNFIPDVLAAEVDEHESKGAGVRLTQFQMAGNSLIAHVSRWPAARYQKAHYHGPGAALLGLEGEGYVLMWPKELGTRPYESGRQDEVVEMKWKEGGIYCPPGGWFHQHFNLSSGPARHIALRYSGRIYPTGLMLAAKRHEDGTTTSIKNGGTMIEYADEDPAIRSRFESELAKRGLGSGMPEAARG